MTAIDTIPFAGGLHAAIYHDTDAGQPFAEDEAVRIVVLHRRHIDPAAGGCGRDPDEVAAWQRENAVEWFTIQLFLYDHGSVAYAVGQTNPFHCPWDSGRVGIIALRRADWGNGQESDATLAAYAQSLADTYTEWANGECYGYVLYGPGGEERDSCWGFIGFDAVREEAAAAADAHRQPGLFSGLLEQAR